VNICSNFYYRHARCVLNHILKCQTSARKKRSRWYKGNYNIHMSWSFCSDRMRRNLLGLTAASGRLNQPTLQRPSLFPSPGSSNHVSPYRFHCNYSDHIEIFNPMHKTHIPSSYIITLQSWSSALPLIPGTLKEEDHGIGLLIGNKEAEFFWQLKLLFIFFLF